MSDVKVGDLVEILKEEPFNTMFVAVGDVAEVIRVKEREITLNNRMWMYSQHTWTYREGEYWKLLPTNLSTPTVEPPTINSEPFITIKGVEVGSSLERALNLVVAVYNGDSVRCNNYGYTSIVRHCETNIGDVVRMLDDEGLDWFTLKSEDEAKLNKEALDKEIKELENQLQELKTKRGY